MTPGNLILSGRQWQLLMSVHRAAQGGGKAPVGGKNAYAALTKCGLVVLTSDGRAEITDAGELALAQRYLPGI